MTIAYWCVLAIIIFPYIFTTLAKWGPEYDNYSRAYLDHLKGWRKRAYWVRSNTFEGSPGFMAAVIIAQQLDAVQSSIDNLAIAYILTRIIYAICYITDKATLRTIFWLLGLGCIISLFVIAA